ncbi:TRAM domain-containing protein [Aliamphritea spongicola]|nr:TRAM domain-containing protein [Aliamphritea spongicola]
MRRANQRHRSKSSQPNKPVSSEPAELVIDSLSHDGRGVGRLSGKATFVSNALPGETVIAKLHNAKSKFNEADCLEVLSASADRVEPFASITTPAAAATCNTSARKLKSATNKPRYWSNFPASAT